MNKYLEHQKLLKKFIIKLQKKFPEARIFERHVGVFRRLNTEQVIKINKKGMADLWMIYKGMHYEFEIKTGKAKQTKEQKQWEQVVKKCGCQYFVIRSLDDVELIKHDKL